MCIFASTSMPLSPSFPALFSPFFFHFVLFYYLMIVSIDDFSAKGYSFAGKRKN